MGRLAPGRSRPVHARGRAGARRALRKRLGALRQRDFLRGGRTGDGRKDITWLRPDGAEMQLADWKDTPLAALAFRLDGDPAVMVLLNGEPAPTTFKVRVPAGAPPWKVAFDAQADTPADVAIHVSGDVVLTAGSLLVLVSDVPVAP